MQHGGKRERKFPLGVGGGQQTYLMCGEVRGKVPGRWGVEPREVGGGKWEA